MAYMECLSVTWLLRSAVHRKDISWCPALTLVQSGERISDILTAEWRDWEAHMGRTSTTSTVQKLLLYWLLLMTENGKPTPSGVLP